MSYQANTFSENSYSYYTYKKYHFLVMVRLHVLTTTNYKSSFNRICLFVTANNILLKRALVKIGAQ